MYPSHDVRVFSAIDHRLAISMFVFNVTQLQVFWFVHFHINLYYLQIRNGLTKTMNNSLTNDYGKPGKEYLTESWNFMQFEVGSKYNFCDSNSFIHYFRVYQRHYGDSVLMVMTFNFFFLVTSSN
jgi:hypothetical protein